MNTETRIKNGKLVPGWGKRFWWFLHGLIEYVPGKDDFEEDVCRDIQLILYLVTELLPCKYCRLHYQEAINRDPPSCNRVRMRKWLSSVHNDVSRRINKDIKLKKFKDDNRKIKKIYTVKKLDQKWVTFMKGQVERQLPFVLLTIDYSIKVNRRGDGRSEFHLFVSALRRIFSTKSIYRKESKINFFKNNNLKDFLIKYRKEECQKIKKMRIT